MKIVDSMPGRQRYPWDEWFDGKVRLLEKGVDFDCSLAGMRSAALSAAKKYGIEIVARVRPEGVYIQSKGSKPQPPTTKESDDGDSGHRGEVA